MTEKQEITLPPNMEIPPEWAQWIAQDEDGTWWANGSKAGIQPSHTKRMRLQLGKLDTAKGPEDMSMHVCLWQVVKFRAQTYKHTLGLPQTKRRLSPMNASRLAIRMTLNNA